MWWKSPSLRPKVAVCASCVGPVLWGEGHGRWCQTACSRVPASNTSQPCDLRKLLSLGLSFLFCIMGIKDLLHRVVVRTRENGAQGQGQCLACIILASEYTQNPTPSLHLHCHGRGPSTIIFPRLPRGLVSTLHHRVHVNIQLISYHLSAQNLQWFPSHPE